MNKKNIWVINLNKIYKRKINTDILYNAMQKLQSNPLMQTKSIKKEEFLEKMAKLKEKAEIKVHSEKYETIQENLNESIKIMKELNANFKNIKENSINIEIKVEKEDVLIQENSLDTLNKGLKNIREINLNQKNIIKGDNILIQDAEGFKESGSLIRKSIFNIEWLQPFLDFMNNHSTLVLTIGSGLVMGGMWYMNNVGIINIGSLLTRLGINILSSTAQNSASFITASSERPMELTRVNQIATNTGNNNDGTVARGFFRELGQKVLKLIDIIIAKMESKQQKYK